MEFSIAIQDTTKFLLSIIHNKWTKIIAKLHSIFKPRYANDKPFYQLKRRHCFLVSFSPMYHVNSKKEDLRINKKNECISVGEGVYDLARIDSIAKIGGEACDS